MRVLVCVFLVVASLPVTAQEGLEAGGPVHVTALAVSETQQGFVGVHADVEARVLSPGTGRVFVATKPLAQTDMQGSARLAAQVAASQLGLRWQDYDYLVAFQGTSTVIGGPSAGAVMSLALTVALQNLAHPDEPWQLDPTVAATGTINPDGTIGPVGGIPAKAEGARDAGIRTFLYPAGLDVATTQVAGTFGPRTITVDMASHCQNLGITCRSVTTLREILQAAAGVTLAEPPAVVPDTQGYEAILEDDIQNQIDLLNGRIEAGAANIPELPNRAANIQTLWDNARQASTGAAQAFANQSYYLAATLAFQGAIQASRAEWQTKFYDADRSEAVVLEGIAACEAAVDNLTVDRLQVSDLNGLQAIGAAQIRAQQARDLLSDAKRFHQMASTYEDWIQSLYQSTFCVERAKTATWWADLRLKFPVGPAVDAQNVATDALDQASDMVLYAQAVLGQATDANARLTEAQAHMASGRHAGAWVAAIQAQTQASVAVQSVANQIPNTVLEAARQGASRAVAHARLGGAEPILAVSLVELASIQTGSQQLSSLWEARSLALVQAPMGDAPHVIAINGPTGMGTMGIVLGFALALAVASIVMALPGPERAKKRR